MKQLHVLLLNYEFPPAGGGAGNATFQIARQLVKLGVKVDVLTAHIVSPSPSPRIYTDRAIASSFTSRCWLSACSGFRDS